MSGPKVLQVAPADVERALHLLASLGLADDTRPVRHEGHARALVPARDAPALPDAARALNATIVMDDGASLGAAPSGNSPRSHPRVRAALSAYRPRNGHLVDVWSFVHLMTCAGLTFLFGPLVAFLIALTWEPLEILVLSPMFARRGIDFGHESLANSLSDVAFNSVGILLAWASFSAFGWSPLLFG